MAERESEKQDLDWEMLLRGSHYNPNDFRVKASADESPALISDLLKADLEEVNPHDDR